MSKQSALQTSHLTHTNKSFECMNLTILIYFNLQVRKMRIFYMKKAVLNRRVLRHFFEGRECQSCKCELEKGSRHLGLGT